MHVIMLWINRYKALSTMLAVLAACLGAYQLQNLKIDTTSAGLIVQGSKDLNFYTEIKKEFGEDNSLTIIYKSDNIFTQEILQSIKNLSDEAEEIAGVTRVVSLATVNNLFITEEGYLNTDSLLPYIPEGEEELNKLRQTSLTHELIIGEVINRSGTVAAIQLSIKRYVKGSGFKDIDSIIKKLLVIERKRLNNKVIIYQISNATISDAMTDAIHSDLKLITPLALLLLSMVLLLFFRSGVAILLPIITGLLSVLVTLGLMSMLGYAINPISLTIPAFILIIGATEDIHILTEYELGIRTLQEKKSAIKQMAIRSGLVIFLTSVTTFAGFITLGPNSIPMISEFGIGAGLGIFANFIITILLAPALLHVLPVPDTFQKPEKKFLINITETLIHLSIKYQKKIFIGSIVFL